MIDLRKIATIGAIVLLPFALAACKNSSGGGISGNQSQTGGSQAETSQSPETGNVITYSASGFSPAEIKIKAGEKVEFKNTSGGKIQVNSNPHPVHTSFPELNIGAIAAGQTKSVTLTRAGTYSYHNHLNASQGGTIVVE